MYFLRTHYFVAKLLSNAAFRGIFKCLVVGDSTNSVSLAHAIGPQNLQESVTGLSTPGLATATAMTTADATIAPMAIRVLTARKFPGGGLRLCTHAVLKLRAAHLNSCPLFERKTDSRGRSRSDC